MLSVGVLAATLGATLLAAAPAQAQRRQPPDQAELQRRYEEKKAKSWVKKAGWTTDYDEALKRAEESGKVIFAYFTRSYAN